MFIYEKGNSLNLTFKGSIPVDNPEVIIKGYEDGATLTVNGTVYGTGTKEFEGNAKTLVFQKDNKLMITFKGIAGMANPEVTIDEVEDNKYTIAINGQEETFVVSDTGIEYVAATVAQEETPAPMTRRTSKQSEPEVTPEEETPVEVVEE